LKDRLSTRNILKRKNMVLPSYECVILLMRKLWNYLFLACPYAQSCWNLIHLVVLNDDPFYRFDIFSEISWLSVFFLSIIIIMCWCIWMKRNSLIFKPSLIVVKARFKTKCALVFLRAKETSKPFYVYTDQLCPVILILLFFIS
jgi:hypothetical protein